MGTFSHGGEAHLFRPRDWTVAGGRWERAEPSDGSGMWREGRHISDEVSEIIRRQVRNTLNEAWTLFRGQWGAMEYSFF